MAVMPNKFKKSAATMFVADFFYEKATKFRYCFAIIRNNTY